MKRIGKVLITTGFLVFTTMVYTGSVYAGAWEIHQDGWRYVYDDGRYAADSWKLLGWNGKPGWYYFDESGVMRNEWFIQGSEQQNSGEPIALDSDVWMDNTGRGVRARPDSGQAVYAEDPLKSIAACDETLKVEGSGSDEADRIIQQFKQDYITDDMNEFEMELMIIQYLVENVEYLETDEKDSILAASSAHGALVDGKAVCMGYAEAFFYMARACGLECQFVGGTAGGSHAWNQVRLDGEWYHVDVTWEDSGKANNGFGFGRLRNAYINLNDRQMRERYHQWDALVYPTACTASEYGPLAVAGYLRTGKAEAVRNDAGAMPASTSNAGREQGGR